MLTKTKKQKVIKDASVKAGDTGSPEVQVSLLTKRIEELTDHLKSMPKISTHDEDSSKWLLIDKLTSITS
jgi:small subunit ribosomal protein S15